MNRRFIKKIFSVFFLAFLIFPFIFSTVEAATAISAGEVVYNSKGSALYINNATQSNNHILVIGDSITQTGCYSSKKDGVCGWRSYLGEQLGQTFTFDTLSQVGRSANRYSVQLPDTFVASSSMGTYDISFIKTKTYKAVFVLIGVNDITGLTGTTASSAGMEAKYQKIITALKQLKGSPPIIFLSVFPACCDKSSIAKSWCYTGIEKRIVDLNKRLSSTATSNGAYYLDLYKYLENGSGCFNPNYVDGDYIHPKNNDATNKFIAEAFVKAVKDNTAVAKILPVAGATVISTTGGAATKSEIKVEFQVPFGEVKTGTTTNFAQYINAVYKYLMGAALVLAGIMFAIGGFRYISSGGNSSTVSAAQSLMKNALFGLLLLASSYLILNTINPNTTELKEVAVEEVGRDTSVQTSLSCGIQGLPCSSDAECGANQFCATDLKLQFLPYRREFIAPEAVTAVETAAHYITEYGGYAAMGAGLLQNALQNTAKFTLMSGLRQLTTSGLKSLAKGLLNSAKYIFKPASIKQLVFYPLSVAAKSVKLVVTTASKLLTYPVRNPKLFFNKINNLGFWAGAAYQVTKGGISMLVAPTETCPSTGKGDGICLSTFFKYNLIPQGMKDSNQEAIHLGIESKTVEGEEIAQYYLKNIPSGYRTTFLYNKDGSLPDRSVMFLTSNDNNAHYLAPPYSSMEKVELNFKSQITNGQTNTDACDPSNNHCPCIEWETYDPTNGAFVCKRQARCVLGNELLNLSGGHNNVSFCLTGDQGEPCLTDNDCRPGNKCLIVKDEATGKANNLVYKGIDCLGQACIDDKTWKNVSMKGDYFYQKQCINLGNFSSSVSKDIDTICSVNWNENIDLCKLGTGIKGVACEAVEVSSNTAVSKSCLPLSVISYFVGTNNKIQYTFETVKDSNNKLVYAKRAKNVDDCYNAYKSLDATAFLNVMKTKWQYIYNDFKTSGSPNVVISTLDKPGEFGAEQLDDLPFVNENAAVINYLGPDMGVVLLNMNATKLKAIIENKNNYAWYNNCYLKIEGGNIGTVTVNGKNFTFSSPYVNLSTLAISGSDRITDLDYTKLTPSSEKGKAIADWFWIKYSK